MIIICFVIVFLLNYCNGLSSYNNDTAETTVNKIKKLPEAIIIGSKKSGKSLTEFFLFFCFK